MAEFRARLYPFVAGAFLSAGLLFSLEPLVGKLLLPQLGGAPAVWNTCLLFFQGMLLAGYAYAHYGVRLLGVRRHAVLHVALVVLSLLALPVTIGGEAPPVATSPVAWLLLTLLRAIGLPFFVLSATAPLVQYWLAGSSHSAARDPYFLYAASNLGSLAGLTLYPLVLEPHVGLRMQAMGWAIVYVSFVILIAKLAWQARAVRIDAPAVTARVPVTTGLRWAAIAAVPSALLLTVTGYITTDIAPMPLLWLAPLALYLATFVVAFGVRAPRAAYALRLIQPALTIALAAVVIAELKQVWLLPAHLLGLTLIAWLAHARLAAERPPAAALTAFYLWLSVGGTLGGVFGAILAPLLLMPELEYVLLLTLALLVPARHAADEPPPLRTVILAAAGLSLAGLAVALVAHATAGAVLSCLAIAILLRRIDRARMAVTLAVAGLLGVFALGVRHYSATDTILRERNFFGTLRVTRAADSYRLVHGRIIHGAQLIWPDEQTTPITYYSQAGPVGDVFRAVLADGARSRIAVVGLGVGTLACYAQPVERWDFFEINPAVVRIATDTLLFRYVDRCARAEAIVLGDGRRQLRDLEDARYDLIMLDAFNSDAVPTHLLTQEAFELYARRLVPGGILLFNISNRYLDLAPVLAANAESLEAVAYMRNDLTAAPIRRTPSRWVVITRDTARLARLARLREWRPLAAEPGFRPWTDDYTSVLSVLRSFRAKQLNAPAPAARP